jgi:hypothetical protein
LSFFHGKGEEKEEKETGKRETGDEKSETGDMETGRKEEEKTRKKGECYE